MAQDQNPYAKYQNQGSEGENPYAKYQAPAPAPAAPEAPAPKSGVVRRLVGDTAVDLGRGVIGVGEAVVGLGSLGTGGLFGKGMEAIGYDPKETKEIIGDYYSPERKLANQKVEQAQGFIGTTAEMLANPSTIAGAVVESVPQMLGGGAVARGLGAVSGLAGRTLTRAAIGEGVVGAGSASEGMRQESDDGLLNARQTAAAVGTGVGTGLIGAAGGAVARRLGIADVDVAAAGGSTARAATDPAAPGLVRRTLQGAVSEGLLEEMPQSMQEQAWQNFGEGKPLMEGVPEAAAAGLLTGGAMGAGFAAASRGAPSNAAPNDPQAQAKPEAPAPDLLALPAPDGTPPSGVNIVTPGGTVLTPEQRGLDPRVMGETAAPVPNPAFSPEPRVWPDSMNQQARPVLPDGSPAPDPAAGSLSRAVNIGMANGAVQRTAALQDAAQAIEQARAIVNEVRDERAAATASAEGATNADSGRPKPAGDGNAQGSAVGARRLSSEPVAAGQPASPAAAEPAAPAAIRAAAPDRPAAEPVTVAEEVSQAEYTATKERNRTAPAVEGDTWDTAKVLRGKPVGDVATIEGADPSAADGAARWTKLEGERWTDGKSTVDTNALARIFDGGETVGATASKPAPAIEAQAAVAPATAADPHAGKWFGTQEKADAYLAKRGIAGTHQVVGSGRRFDIKPKAVQPAAASAEKTAPKVQQEEPKAQGNTYGLPRVVRKPDIIRALRQNAGMTVAQATEAYQAIDREGLKEGTRSRAQVVAAIEAAKADSGKPVTVRKAGSGAVAMVIDPSQARVPAPTAKPRSRAQIEADLDEAMPGSSRPVDGTVWHFVPGGNWTDGKRTITRAEMATALETGRDPTKAGAIDADFTIVDRKAGSKSQTPTAGNEGAAQPTTTVAPDGWRGNLVKSRVYARDLIEAGDLDGDAASAAWGDADALAALIDGQQDELGAEMRSYEAKADRKAPAAGQRLESATAPEHVNTGVGGRELSEIVAAFDAAEAENNGVTKVFAAPAKSEIVRIQDKVKVYHKEHGWMTPAEAKARVAEWKAAAQAQGKDRSNGNSQRVVLSLFDLTGSWSKPWEEAGYQVYRFDIQDDWVYEDDDGTEKRAGDVHNFSSDFFEQMFGHFEGNDVYAILAACPCTDFAVSGARHFAAKDADGRTVASVQLVQQTLATIEYFKPAVWAIENPVGRIEKLGGLPPWRTSFDPNHFGEDYTKKTLLWGRHNADMPIAPTEATEGSKMHRLYGGKSQATKNARSETPEGFAYAFFMANNAVDNPVLAIANKYDRLDRALIERAVAAGITEQQITDAVDDFFYSDMDDDAANQAIQELIDEAAPPPKPAQVRAAPVKARKPAPKTDKAGKPMDLLRVIAASGGLNRAAWARHGVDPAEFTRRAGFQYVFRKQGGMTPSDLREFMQQEGYLAADRPDMPATVEDNDAIDLFDRAFRGGEEIFSPDQHEAVARWREAQQYAEEEYRENEGADAFDEWMESAAAPSDMLGAPDVHDLLARAEALGATQTELLNAGYRGVQATQDLIDRLEKDNADSTGSGASDGEASDVRRPADTGTGGSGLAQRRPGAANEAQATGGDLFGRATAREEVEAERRRRDAERDGRTGNGRTDMLSGGGELFAGPRPAQADIEQVTEQAQGADPSKTTTSKFAGNKLFTADKVEAARARLRAKLGRLNSGFDPELLIDGMTIAGGYIEIGVRKFSDFAKAMVDDLGDSVKPYLLSFYEGARSYPGLDTEGMDSVDDAARAHERLLAPADLETEAVGERRPPAKKRAKATTSAGERRLVDDYGTDRIDGYTPLEGGENRPTDYGLAGGVKDQFLKDTASYLRGVASILEEAGYTATVGQKGKANKTVSVNEGGPAVSGDVHLHMVAPAGTGIYATIGASSLRGVVPGTASGISLMYRTTDGTYSKSGTNQWGRVDLTAAELAAELMAHVSTVEARTQRATEMPHNAPTEGVTNVRRQDDQPGNRAGSVPGNQRQQPAENRNDDVAAGVDQQQRQEAARNERSGRAGEGAQAGVSAGAGRGQRDPAEQQSPDAGGVPAERGIAPDPVTPKTDLTITTELDFTGIGAVGKFNQNLAAIRLLKKLEAENRRATPAEQSTLAKYVGWGGLPQAFKHPTSGKVAKGWEGRVAELAEVMTADELAAAGRSTQDAHYTASNVVTAMWDAVERMGFRGGRVLEPSMGTGNFFGLMPAKARSASQLTGVELDSITGRIAKQLYQNANVQVRGFNDIRIAPGSFDLAIGNPPFGSQSIHDPQYPDLSKASIHNYFFAKSIASVRPGGVLAMVVSSSFLDANTSTTRAWIAERAQFLGAIRLPQTAFQANAGTNVTTDIVFLQRLPEGATSNANDWVRVGSMSDQGESFPVNNYFVKNPDMMLGRMVWSTHTTIGRAGAVLEADKDADLSALLAQAVAKLPQDVYQQQGKTFEQAAVKASPAPQSVDVPVSAKVYGFFTAPDGSLRQRQPDLNGEQQSVAVDLPDTSVARVKGMARIRDLARGMLRAELDERTTDAALDNARAELNKAYDQFVKDNGLLSRDVNKRLMRDDPDAPLLLSLERDYDAGVSPTVAKKLGVASRKESARKADIFTKRTNYPVKPVTSVADAQSAMLASLNERGRLDPEYMQSIYPGKTIEDIEAELGDAVFREPSGNLVPADAYLSGNVKAKLAEARASNDPRMARNIAALEAVQPVDVEPTDIFVQVGSPWVPVEDYNTFAAETFGGQVKGRFSQPLGSWHVDITSNNQMLNHERWGHERMGAATIMEQLMGNKPIAIYDRMQDGSRVLNTEDTAAAKGKATELQQEFLDWIWRDAGRRERLSRVFNDTYNTDVRRNFNGAHLTFPGMNRNILSGGNLRPHQSAFVYRVVQDGVALADHTVGAGKTYAAIASVMEMRRLGLWRKPMIVVPNHLVDQWATDFVRLYPGANVLAASRKDFTKGNRQRLFARIATGDWDAVIVAHSSFGFIPLPRETEQRILEQEVEEITVAMDEIRRTEGKKDMSFKQLQKRQEALQERIKRQAERPRDDLMDFEEMGVDALTVDEAHEFKNLYFVTSQRNVAGLGSPEGSKKAFDLFVKMRYLAERGDGKNRVFLTGTPVSNTLSEVFHMQRYLQFEELQRRGIGMFDAWAGTFGQIVSDWEMDAANRFKEKSRFRKFANLPELVTMWRQVADTVTLADLRRDAETQGQRFPVPKIKGGKRQNVTVPRSPLQAQFIGEPVPALDAEGNPVVDPETGIPLERYPEGSIIHRMDNMPKDPSIDNHLKATGDARKASLDYRLVDPSAPDFAGSKINRAVDNIVRAWRENNHRKGTQLVFCDLSVPASARGKATEAAQAAQPTWFIRHGDNIEHVPGVKLALSAMADRKFFSHKTKRDGYRIYDANSGVFVASGKAKQDAIDDANAKLANDPATWSRRFEQGAIPGEQIEAYVQRWEDEKASKDEGQEEGGEQATQAISMDELLADESKHSVYDDMKAKLIAAGMPEREIAFIHDYNTDLQKADLFAKVNRGDIRVLFGSTAKMGAGMNVQKKLVALHHMDAPWRPSDLTQREGRILRQGNEFYEADPDGFEVELYAYGTEQTYDARQWEIIETKASGIETFQAGDASVREIDDISSEAANAADMKGAASGNPLILESIKLRKEVKDLESQERSHRRSVHAMESLIRSVDNRSAYAYRNLDAAEAQAKKFEGAEFNMKLGRVTFAEAKEVTGDAILAQFEDAVMQREPIRAGQFRGLDIVVEPRGGTMRVSLYDGKESIGNTEFGANDKVTPAGFVTRLENLFKRITTGLADAKAMVARTEREAAQAREEVGRGFPKAAELNAKRERQRKVVAALRAGRTEVEGDDQHLDYAITDLRRNGAGRPESAATRELVNQAIADGDLAAMLHGIAKQEGVDPDQAALATRLAGIVPNLSIKLVQEPANAPAAGLYNNIDGTMWIHQALPSVVIHETEHGITSALLTNPTARQSIPGVAKAVAEFEDLLQVARDRAAALDMSKLSPALRATLQDPRGALSNIKELLTYGTTDKLFQMWLATVPAPTGRDKARTGWQAFKDAVANLLGLRGRTRSALDALLESTDDLLSLAENNPRAVELVRKLEGKRQAGARAAARDRSGIKSSNGQAQTETAEFKRWFGGSKVVDDRGEPAVMYHGTSRDFSEFRPSAQAGGLIFFASTPRDANEYASGKRTGYETIGAAEDVANLDIAAEGAKVRITDEGLLPDDTTAEAAADFFYRSNVGEVEAIGYALEEGAVTLAGAIRQFNDYRTAIMGTPNVMPVYLRAENPAGSKENPIPWREAENKGAEHYRRLGHDAVYVTEGDGYALAVFSPEQIKSATGNNGNFDPGDPAVDRAGFDPARREWLAKHGAQDDARIPPFMELARRVAAAEKSSDPADWTDAERDAYGRGDTAEFSRLRGYTKAEIAEHQQYLQQADALIADYGVDFVAGLGQNPDGSFDFARYVDAIDLAAKGPGKEAFARLKDMFKGLKPENLRENTRPAWLGALTMRHLAELGGDIKVSHVGDYADVVQRMATDRNIMQEGAGKTADAWEKFQRKDRAGADATANLMHDTTIKGIDPSKAYEPLQTGSTSRGKSEPVTDEAIERRIALVKHDLAKARPGKEREGFEAEMASLKSLQEQERERRRLYPELVQRYQALPAEGRKLYVDVRDAYERQSDRMLDALEARINSLELDGRVRAEMIGKVRQQFESAKLNGPYFPLQRFGDFWISAENAQGEPSFMLYERVQDWREAQRDLKDQGYTIKAAGRKLDEARSLGGASGGFMADLQGLLSQAGVDEDTRDDVYQLYLRTLPELSVRKHQIHRKATKGYSNDALRAFSANLFHGSFQVARLRWSHELEASLLAMKKQVQAMASDDPERAAKAGALYSEMNKRHEWVMNPRDSKVASVLTSLGFAWYLGTTPAAALVNLTQTAIVSFPVLAAKYGPVKAFNALSEAMGRAARSVNGDITKGLSAEEVDAFRVWREAGTIDKSQAHSLAGLSESDTKAFNPVAKRTMEIVSWLFHKAEVVNREATALAAFRLARAGGQSFDQATRYASDVVTESHFDYSNANRARFMQSNAAKVLLLFRQYSLNMTWFLWRNLYQSIKAESPEVKREARIKLGGVLGMTGVFAGVMGMPLMSVMFGIANAAAAAFGGGDDEPWDAEVAFRNFLADMLGADLARVLARGPVDAITGASFSSRVSLNDLWLRESNKDLEGQAQANYLLEQAAGPIFGGMLVNTLRGLKMVGDGHTMRGIETMMPKAIKDGMKALRYSTEGVNTMRGDPVIADLGVGGSLLQLAGFAPAQLNERYDGINAAKRYETRIMDRRSSLLNAYAMAWRNSDADATAKVLDKIRAFNAANPAVAISASTIRQSMQARLRYSSRADGGVVLNPKLAAQAKEQARFAE